MVYNLSLTNSILNVFLRELRDIDIHKDRLRFRKNLERIGNIIAYEISKTLEYKFVDINTPLVKTKAQEINKQPVIATILRAGLPLFEGVLNFFDNAENAFISAYRKEDENNLDYIIEYCSSPNLDNKTLIITDPMLATGWSMIKSLEKLINLKGKPSNIHIVGVIASQKGIDTIIKQLPNVNIWVASIDSELNDKNYIVPGLGDAGDLAFGVKD